MSQNFQAMPKLDARIANVDGTITIPWYRLLITLWNKTGGANVPTTGVGLFSSSIGGTEILQVLAASPFTFVAPVVGFLTAAGGKIELSRSGPWREVSITGGSFWLQAGDSARVTWFGDAPPEVIWWPTV